MELHDCGFKREAEEHAPAEKSRWPGLMTVVSLLQYITAMAPRALTEQEMIERIEKARDEDESDELIRCRNKEERDAFFASLQTHKV